MAEWISDQTTAPAAPRWTVRGSLVVECAWALFVLGDEGDDYPIRRAFFAQAPELPARITDFWHDSSPEYLELIVLAKRAGCLWTCDRSELLAGLRRVISGGVGDETLDSERPEVILDIRTRLRRLAEEPDTARRWLDLVEEIAERVAAALDGPGRLAVEMATRAQSALASRSSSWPHLPKEAAGCAWIDLLPVLAAKTVAAGGEVVVVCSWLARKNFFVSLGDLVILGRGVGEQSLPAEATRDAARRLRALADPMRLAAITELALRPRSVGELARDLEVSQPTVSNHVRILRDAGVVREGPRPRQRQLEVNAEGVRLLLDEVRTLVLGEK